MTSSILAQEPIKIAQLIILGALGTFFAFRGLRAYNKKKPAPVEDSSVAHTKEDLIKRFGAEPEVLKDQDTNEYLVFNSTTNDYDVITPEEIKTLTGQYPEDYALETNNAEPEVQQDLQGPNAPVNGVIGPEDFEDFAEDLADPELEARNQLLENQQAGPGPATARRTKIIGAKKAKSLQRKDQKRAYNEYQREVSLAQRADQEEFDRQYGDLIAAEREERRLRNEAAEKERQEQLALQREKQEMAALEKESMRKQLQELKPGSYLPISNPEEVALAHSLKDAFVVDNESYIVRFSEDDMKNVANEIKSKGALSYGELANILTTLKA